MNYYERHLGDYARDTGHLSMLEQGAYTLLLDRYYSTEAGIPKEQAHRICRARSQQERAAVDAVLNEFFVLVDDGWHQSRCDAEIARFKDKQRKAKASADARWHKVGGTCGNDATAMRTHTDRNANGMHRAPVPSHQSPDYYVEPNGSTSSLPLPAVEACDPPQSAGPPPPPPDFDGLNAEILNGKAVVPIAAGFRLPEDWGLDAMALGFGAEQVLREGERFRQYWAAGAGKGKRRTVKGWRQTWSNWLGKAGERAGR